MNMLLNILLVLLLAMLSACTTPQATPAPTSVAPTQPPATATQPPAATDPQPEVSPERIAAAETLLANLVSEDYQSVFDTFDATMVEALPVDQLESVWQLLLSQVGAYKEQISVRTDHVEVFDRVFVTAAFEQANLEVTVVFDVRGRVSGLFFNFAQDAAQPAQDQSVQWTPPDYVDTSTFSELDFTVGPRGLNLPGTLTLPNGEGPFAVVVLVHGSGPHDRDESIGPNKPFRDLAWGLASRGIAVLRYDKRTLVYRPSTTLAIEQITVREETIEDALDAVNRLRQTNMIDTERIFVLGHSLGGMLAPWIGTQDTGIAGFIIMAGATRPLEDVIVDQVTYIQKLDANITDEEQQQLAMIQSEAAQVKALDPSAGASNPGQLLLGVPAGYWLALKNYQPAQVVRRIEQPMFIVQGLRDYQVTKDDFTLWETALSDRTDVEFKLYPALNHLFIEGQGPSSPGEYQVRGHVASYVIDDIATWVNAQ